MLTSLLLILVFNLIRLLGSFNETNNIEQQFNFLSIELGGPSVWVLLLSDVSLIVISIAFTIYFLKKNTNYKDVFKIILLSAILFSIVGFAKFLVTARTPDGGGAVEYLSPLLMEFSYDFTRGVSDILGVIFSRFLIFKSLFYILLPSALVIGINKFRKR